MGATSGSPRAVVRINYDAARIMLEDTMEGFPFFNHIQEKGMPGDVYSFTSASEASDFITETKPDAT
jgi:hypothetical protein